MIDFLQWLADLSVPIFVVSSMLEMGLSQRLEDVTATLKKPRLVMLALLANFVLSPLLAMALSRLIPLQPAHAIGLLLLGGAGGAPFIPKLAEICGGSLSYSVALMVLLIGGSIIFMPLALPLIVPGLKADPWSIARPLLLLMLIPLAVGFTLARSGGAWVGGLLFVVRKVANIALVLLVILMLGLNLKTLVSTVGSFAIGTYALYLLAIVGAAYVLGARDKSTQAVFALGAGCRNISAALVVALASFDDPATTVMLLVAFVVGLVVLFTLAKTMRPRAAG